MALPAAGDFRERRRSPVVGGGSETLPSTRCGGPGAGVVPAFEQLVLTRRPRGAAWAGAQREHRSRRRAAGPGQMREEPRRNPCPADDLGFWFK